MRPSLPAPILCSLWVLGSLLVATPARADFSVAPTRITRSVSATDNVLELVISNSGDKALEVFFSAVPVTHDREGAPSEGTAAYAYDASKHIHFDKVSVILAPRRWKRIRARVEVPQRAGGGYAYVYASAREADIPETQKVVNVARIAVLVALTYPDAGKSALAVENMELRGGQLRVAVRNEGQTVAAPSGQLVVRDLSGKPVWTGKLEPGNILPERVRELKVDGLPIALTSGQYTAHAEIRSPVPVQQAQRLAVVEGQLILGKPVLAQQGR